jgi:hypothetical protein
VVMNISDLPTTVLVRHDVSRFMLRFLRLSLQTLDGNARVRHRFRSYGAGLMLNRAPAATRPLAQPEAFSWSAAGDSGSCPTPGQAPVGERNFRKRNALF